MMTCDEYWNAHRVRILKGYRDRREEEVLKQLDDDIARECYVEFREEAKRVERNTALFFQTKPPKRTKKEEYKYDALRKKGVD